MGMIATSPAQSQRPYHSAAAVATEAPLARFLLTGLALAFLGLFLIVPLAVVLTSGFANGVGSYITYLTDSETRSAIWLTIVAAAVSVPLNLLFGLSAAWLISKYEFPGKGLLVTLIDLPFSVSPVVAGLIFVLLFGASGWFAPLLEAADIKVIFAVPGIIIATTFITFPLIAREVLAVMQAQGSQEEEAALTLGASGWQVFYRITLAKAKWGILYGIILCNARAMGEFGAVSVVSGHIRGETNTLPLHVEILYGEYQFAAAFAVASLLTLLAVITLVLKHLIEWRELRSRHSELQPSMQPSSPGSAEPQPL